MKIQQSELKGVLNKLIKTIIDFNLPFELQQGCGSGVDRWCSDYWHREVASCLIDGIEKYMNTQIPDYLNDNDSFSKPEIVRAVMWKYDMMKCIEENQDFSDTLMVCECGWGIDVILCSTIKDWKKIIVYDGNRYMIREAESFLRRLGFEVDVDLFSSTGVDFSKIDERMVLVANYSHIPRKSLECLTNKSNVLSIVDGIILKPREDICKSLR